jgi:hypothetical protein
MSLVILFPDGRMRTTSSGGFMTTPTDENIACLLVAGNFDHRQADRQGLVP